MNAITKTISIGNTRIGPGHPTYIIFEVASTHKNDWETAREYVEQAKRVGANALKFQLFTADGLILPATAGMRDTRDYFRMAETPREWFPKLKELCDAQGIDLLCTPFDVGSAEFLDDVGIPAVKIASGDLTNHELLRAVAGFGKPIILSTGMGTMEEIHAAVHTLRENGARDDIVILQSVSVYPTSFEDANVRAMVTMGETFETLVGYSDNGSKGALVPLLSVALGACIIEKHVTSKKERGDIDDVFSMGLDEFADMVRRIRAIETRSDKEAISTELQEEFGADVAVALGDGVKRPAPHGTEAFRPSIGKYLMREADERHWARRGVYLTEPVQKGAVIRREQVILLRPDVGIGGVAYELVIGAVAGEDLPAHQPLKKKGDTILRFRRADIAQMYTDPADAPFAETLAKGALPEYLD